jgi:hypothetical protein
MLMITGMSLFGAGYLVFRFAQFICRYRPASMWASEAAVLVVLTPAVMILLAGGGACLGKFWFDGGLQEVDRSETTLAAVLAVLIVVFARLAGRHLRAPRNTPA